MSKYNENEEQLRVLSEIDWSQLIEIFKLVAAPLGAIFGAFIGSYLASYWTEKRRNRREHFDRLKNIIFNPWKDDLRFHNLEHCIRSNYGSPLEVRSLEFLVESNVLFEDITNHFPDLIDEWASIKRKLSEYYDECLLLVQRIEKMLVEKTELHMIIRLENEKGFMHDFVRKTYNTLIDLTEKEYPRDMQFKITKSKDFYELKTTRGTYAQGSEEELKKCKSAFEELVDTAEFKRKARELIERVEVITQDIGNFKRRLGRIIEMTKLPRDCSYI